LDQGNVNPNINSNGFHVLLLLATNGNKEMIELYFSKGGNLNVVDVNKSNALHSSAYRGHLETTKYLVSIGIDFKAKNGVGKTPSDLARQNKMFEVLKFLQEVEQK